MNKNLNYEAEEKKSKYDDNSSSNIEQNFQNGKELKMEETVSEEGSEDGNESVDPYEEAFTNQPTPTMSDEEDSKTGEVKSICEKIDSTQISPTVAEDNKPPASPIVNSTNEVGEEQPPTASPISIEDTGMDIDKPPTSPKATKPTDDAASVLDKPQNTEESTVTEIVDSSSTSKQLEEEISDPTKLQMRKINFKDYKQYFENVKPPMTIVM